MEALTLKEQDLIVNNVLKACSDINKLNSRGYKYLSLCCGFIAHYNLQGFKSHYDDEGFFATGSLEKDILANEGFNQWLNFREGDKDYHYYKSKAAVYIRICNKLKMDYLNLYNT